MRPPLESKGERVQALLDSVPVAYVVLDNTAEGSRDAYLLPLLQGNTREWKLVYTDEKGPVRIYERVRAGEGDKGE